MSGIKKQTAKRSRGGCVFKTEWLTNIEFRLWISRSDGPNSATCKLCQTKLNIQRMGKTALISHADSKKHKARIAELRNTPSMANMVNRSVS